MQDDDDNDDWRLENELMTSAQVGSISQLTEYEEAKAKKKKVVRMGFHPPEKAYKKKWVWKPI